MLSPVEMAPDHGMEGLDFRTEDVRFSPSGRRLAVTATDGVILLFEVDPDSRPVQARLLTMLRSDDLALPHGADFLEEDRLVVANRKAAISVHRIPRANRWEEETSVPTLSTSESSWFGEIGGSRLHHGRKISVGPGSVRVHDGDLFICCNDRSTVTHHHVTEAGDGAIRIDDGRLVANEDVEIPDSVALSGDDAWMAVSNHQHQSIDVFDRASGERVCRLTAPDMTFPHGVAIDPTGTAIIAADAGGPYLHVFRKDGGWGSEADPEVHRLQAVPDRILEKTRADVIEWARPLEGGVKGVDVHHNGRLVATTCRGQMLRFFELDGAGEGERANPGLWGRIRALWS